MMKAVAVLLLLAVAGARAQGTPDSVAAAVAATPDLASLGDLLKQADLLGALGPDFTGTVFAPTNDAVDAALEAVGAAGLELSDEQLKEILTYHVVAGEMLMAADLTDGEELQTLAGKKAGNLTVNIKGKEVIIKGKGSKAKVVSADNMFGNGVVHIIDAVLLPFKVKPADMGMTLVDVLEEKNLTGLISLLETAGLTQAVEDLPAATIFAPTNEAIEGAVKLAAAAGITLTPEVIGDILKVHVVNETLTAADLMDGEMLPTLLGQDITVEIMDGMVHIKSPSGNEVMVTMADIMVGDKVVHVIDGVLLPSMGAPPPMEAPTGSATSVVASFATLAAAALAALLV